MFGYTAYKNDDQIPADWQVKEQLAAIDLVISGMNEWFKELKSLGTLLIYAQSESSRDYGYEGDYGDAYVYQNPQGDILYEGANPEDFDMSPVQDYHSYEDMMGITSEDFILGTYPSPYSTTLTNIEREIWEVAGVLFILQETIGYAPLFKEWKSTDGDPAIIAHEIGENILEFVDEYETEALFSLNKLRSEWGNETDSLAESNYQKTVEEELDNGAINFVRYAEDVLSLADEAIESLEQATPTRANEEVKYYASILDEAATQAEDVPGMMVDDAGFMSGAAEDIKEIARRSFHSDIRAWEARGVQKDDAILAFSRVRSYWAKRLDDVSDVDTIRKINRLASKSNPGTVPNYRYKVGQMVKVKKSRRYGKVVGARLEGGTGKQVYEVKVNGVDKAKLCYVDEIERA